MATNLSINGINYTFPAEGENPPWGSDVADWAIAVTNVLGSLAGETDILNSSFSMSDAVSSPLPIIGFSFDLLKVKTAIIDYAIYREASTEKVESGTLTLTNTGTSLNISRESTADVGIDLTIDVTGQFFYKSDRGTGPATFKYRAKTSTI
jgi:hypothetical protein